MQAFGFDGFFFSGIQFIGEFLEVFGHDDYTIDMQALVQIDDKAFFRIVMHLSCLDG